MKQKHLLTKILTLLLLLGSGVGQAWADDVIFGWRMTGTSAPEPGNYVGGFTGGSIVFNMTGTYESGKWWSAETSTFNASVSENYKSSDGYGVKAGGNLDYIKVTLSDGQTFKPGDVITICGYNPWKISTSTELKGEISTSLTTGSAKDDYNVGSVTIPVGVQTNTIYLSRAKGSSTGIASFDVIRPSYAVTVSSSDNTKGSVYFTVPGDDTHYTTKDVASGTEVKFYATPNNVSNTFDGWKVNGGDQSKWDNPQSVTITETTNYVGVFNDGLQMTYRAEPLDACTVFAYFNNNPSWRIANEAYVNPNTDMYYDVDPSSIKSGYAWLGWYDGETNTLLSSATSAFHLGSVTTNRTIIAKFKQLETSDLTLSSTSANVLIKQTNVETGITVTSSSTGAYTITSSKTKAVQSATISDGKLLVTTGTATGTVTLSITQAADANYKASETKTVTITVGKPKLNLEMSCTNNSVNIITPNVAGSTIYYTVDGSNPTSSSNKFAGDFRIYGNQTIKAFATANDYNDSDIKTINAQFTNTLNLNGNGKIVMNTTSLIEPTSNGVLLPKASLSAEDVSASGTWKQPDGTTNALELPGSDNEYYEYYFAGGVAEGNILTQTLTGLTNGTYEVTMDVAASYTPYRGFVAATGNDITVAFAGTQEVYIPVAERSTVTISQYNQVVFTVDVTDGTLSYGLKNKKNGGNWFVAKLVSLKKIETSFISWNTNPNGTGSSYNSGTTYHPTSNGQYLYAQWPVEYTYFLNAVDESNNVIDVIETGTTVGKDVYFPLVIEANGKFYKTSETTFKKTFTGQSTTADQTINVAYTLDNSIAGYVEGESAKNGTNASYSNGGYGHVDGTKSKLVNKLKPGYYTVSAYLVNDGNRCVYLYEGDKIKIADTGIESSSPKNQLYTSGIFTIYNEKEVSVGGYLVERNGKLYYNQSAEFDYAYISYVNGLMITKQPVGNTYYACPNAPALTIETYAYNNGFVTPTYQWYSNDNSSNEGGTLIAGATSASYVPNTSAAGTTYYYCVVTLDDKTVTSEPAQIKVIDGITCSHGSNVHADGNIPTGGFLTNYSQTYELETAKERTFTFNVTGGDNGWNNYYMVLSTAPGHVNDPNFDNVAFPKLYLRGDGYGWQPGYNKSNAKLIRQNGSKKEFMTLPAKNDDNLDQTFINDMKNASVTMKVSYSGTHVYIYTKIVSNTDSHNVYYLIEETNDIIAGRLYLTFGTDGSVITGLNGDTYKNAYSVSAKMSNPQAGAIGMTNADGNEIPNGTYIGDGESVRVEAEILSGYKLDSWSSTGTTGTPNSFVYNISAINDNTEVTANTGVSSYSLSRNDGKNVNYVITKGSDTSFNETLPTITNLGGASVEWSYRVVTDATTEFNKTSTLKVDNQKTGTISGTTVNITSLEKTDGGAVVVTAKINNSDILSYVITVPYIGNHVYDMHDMADKPDVKATGHWSLGYELIEGVKHKDPLVMLGDKVNGNNADIIDETNGLYVVTEGVKNIGLKVIEGAYSNETDQYTIADVRGVNLLAVKNTKVTIPQVKKDWFIKVYLDPHAGGTHSGGSGCEFSITNAKDLVGKAINPAHYIACRGVQWRSDDAAGKHIIPGSKQDTFLGCMIFRAANDGDVTLGFSNNGWNKIVRIEVTNKFSTEMVLGSTNETPNTSTQTMRAVDYLRWNHSFVHRVYDDGNGGETGSGTNIYYNGDANCHAENAYPLDHKIARFEGTLNSSDIVNTSWKSPNGATYQSASSSVSSGVGNMKIISNATYQGGTGYYKDWVSAGVESGYVLNRNESWIVVGKLKVQKYPYTWDFDSYNMSHESLGGVTTMSNINSYMSAEAKNDTIYGSWTGSTTNKLASVMASASATDDDSPYYTIDENTGTKTYDYAINKPLWANGAQLTYGTTAIPETEGLGVALGQAYYWTGHTNYSEARQKQITLDGSKLGASVNMSITIPEVDAGMYIFVKSNIVPTTASTNVSSANSEFAQNSDGNVTVFKVNTAGDVVLDFASGSEIYRIGVTNQIKEIKYYGWATESRAIAIDHKETDEFSAATQIYQLKNIDGWKGSKYTVGTAQAEEIAGDVSIPAGTGILIKTATSWSPAQGLPSPTPANIKVPLFVPAVNIPSVDPASLTGNQLVPSTTSSQTSVTVSPTKVTDGTEYYTMSNYCYKVDKDNKLKSDKIVTAPAFYRYIGSGATMTNKAYLIMGQAEKPSSTKLFSYGVSFDDDVYDATVVEDVESDIDSEDDIYYNVSGQQLDGKPTMRGIFIKNGKKFYNK